MEGSQMRAPVSERSEAGTVRATQIGLLVIFNLFGLGVVGLFLATGGAALAAPGGLGNSWYVTVAGGAIVAVLSRLIADSAETLGGWLGVAGGLAIVIGSALGYPVKGERED
jgi:hypothetical protein